MSFGSGCLSDNYLSAKRARSRARAQMRAASGERPLPRQFRIVHILFRNLNSASTGNVWAIKSSGTSKGLRATDAFVTGWRSPIFECTGNIKFRTRVWLSEALIGARNYTETFDDQIHIPWRGRFSVNRDCNSSNGASSYPGAGRIRLSLSQWGFGNWINTISATRSSRRWRSRRRQRINTACPFIERRTRDCNQTLVGAGRPPPAARSRCSNIDIRISADP